MDKDYKMFISDIPELEQFLWVVLHQSINKCKDPEVFECMNILVDKISHSIIHEWFSYAEKTLSTTGMKNPYTNDLPLITEVIDSLDAGYIYVEWIKWWANGDIDTLLLNTGVKRC